MTTPAVCVLSSEKIILKIAACVGTMSA